MKLTQERVAKALTKTGAMVAETAKLLGVSRQSLYLFLQRYPELQQLRTEIEDEMLDEAEGHLATAVRNGDLDACMYYLSTKGKNRGFTTSVEIVRTA
ncbi:MAG: hypothetical protein E5X67_07260 [Mesorhizobium sp.]|uniref:hypothetical protein n=1 Tax=Mesorhizobium sp. TaxID=1871066 RepID=UPI001205B53F|nr:hypothetical protein [Mesorhizobium sp.]TIP29395.1 MAG: hypothetical protein E5X67_07260 [Mesorhizobium sp.]